MKEVGLQRPSLEIDFLRDSIRRREKRSVEIALMGPMEVIGEEYLLGDKPLDFSAICDSEECEVYELLTQIRDGQAEVLHSARGV